MVNHFPQYAKLAGVGSLANKQLADVYTTPSDLATVMKVALERQPSTDLLTTHIESFCDNIEELKRLFEIHYREISQHKLHNIELNPDYDKYRMKEAMGELLFIALRQNGRLVGYFNGFIGSALHYRDCLQLALDLIYVVPGCRGQINGQHGGTLLRNAAIAEARRRGVKLFTMGYKSARAKHMKKLLEDGGFEPFEVHYGLWL